jgi:hypothetical protein
MILFLFLSVFLLGCQPFEEDSAQQELLIQEIVKQELVVQEKLQQESYTQEKEDLRQLVDLNIYSIRKKAQEHVEPIGVKALEIESGLNLTELDFDGESYTLEIQNCFYTVDALGELEYIAFQEAGAVIGGEYVHPATLYGSARVLMASGCVALTNAKWALDAALDGIEGGRRRDLIAHLLRASLGDLSFSQAAFEAAEASLPE